MSDIAKRPFKISVASELMKNQVPAEVVGHSQAMVSVHDLTGEPMLFSIGNDGVLNVVMRSGANRIGWQTFPLTKSGNGLKAVAFAVGQLDTGQIILATVMAPDSVGEVKKSSLYRVATPLINDPVQTDWGSVKDMWEECRHPDGDVVITQIRIGAGTANNFPIGVASVRGAGSGETQWMFNADARDTKWAWERFDVPEDTTGRIVLAAGTVLGVRGAYALYDTSAGQSLEFRGLTDEITRKSLHRAFNLPARVETIIALATTGDSDLYAGGAGLYVFPGSREEATTIAARDRLPAVHELVITQDPGTVCVFAHAGDGRVFHCEGTGADARVWGTPLQIMSGVSRIAAARNTSRVTNQIFAAKGKSDLLYLYQDPASTLWKETEIRLPATNRVAEFMTFTTHVRVTDATGQAMVHTNLKVSADTWTQLFLNGALHGVDGNEPVTVVTDLFGDLTIVSDAMDISAPTITLQVDGEQPVTHNPAEGVKGKLAKVKDLAAETLPDGQPLLNELQRKDTETCKSVKDGMQTLLAGPPKKSARSDATALGAHSEGVVWGMTITGPKVQFHQHRASALLARVEGGEDWRPSATDWLDAIKAKAGDCLQWMWEKIKEGARLFWRVVEGAFQVLVRIGEQILTFVIKGIETTLKVVSWLLQKALGIDLEKIWKWLGFIFDWEDIKRTHAVIRGLVCRLMDDAKAGVARFEAPVAQFFKNLRTELGHMASLPGGDKKFADARRRVDEAPADSRERADKTEAAPGTSWGQHHFVHSGAMGGAGPVLGATSDALSQFMTTVVEPALSSAQAGATEFVKELRALFNDELMTAKQLIARLVSGTAMKLLDVLEKIALGALKFLGEVIELLRTGLTASIQIPFFSAFYKDHISGGHDLSILDLVTLLAAIPATIAFKLATGKAPFPADAKPLDLSGIFGVLREQPHRINLAAGIETAGIDRLGDSAKNEASPGEKLYSQIGAFGYAFCVAFNDVLNLMQIAAQVELFEMAEFKAVMGESVPKAETLAKMQKIGENAHWVMLALGATKIACSFPVGNKEQVTLQRWAWGVTLAGVIAQFVVGMKVKNKWVKGTCKAAFVGTTFGLQTAVFAKYECVSPGPNEDAVLKYVQNCFYFLADSLAITASLAPDPETKTYLLIGTVFPIAGGGLTNVLRAGINAVNNVEHHNF